MPYQKYSCISLDLSVFNHHKFSRHCEEHSDVAIQVFLESRDKRWEIRGVFSLLSAKARNKSINCYNKNNNYRLQQLQANSTNLLYPKYSCISLFFNTPSSSKLCLTVDYCCNDFANLSKIVRYNMSWIFASNCDIVTSYPNLIYFQENACFSLILLLVLLLLVKQFYILKQKFLSSSELIRIIKRIFDQFNSLHNV